MSPSVTHDRKDFINFCEGIGGKDEALDFRILWPDAGGGQNCRGKPAEVFHHLAESNSRGAGIFMTINQTDGQGQTGRNITGVRAVFLDLDGGVPIEPILEAGPEPHLVVKSSPGKFHVYYKLSDCPLHHFQALQTGLAERFGGDKSVNDLPRIMRAPGLLHQKGEPFLSHIIQQSDHPPFTMQALIDGLGLDLSPANDSEHERAPSGGSSAFNINRPVEEGQRTTALTHFIGKYIQRGMNDDEILLIVRSWNERNLKPLEDKVLISTLASIRKTDRRNRAANDEAHDSVVDQINEQHALVMVGGKCQVLREVGDQVDFMTVQSFREFNRNLPRVGTRQATVYWQEHPNCRKYNDVVFDPSQSAANDSYNLYRGFAYEPVKGDCSLYLEHIANNIAKGDKEIFHYLLDWMAQLVQQPDQLIGVAIVLRGRRGNGKGTFATHFGALFGKHFKHIQTADQLTGRFNWHHADTLFNFADEVVWGGDKQREGVLKTMITEKTFMAEGKGKDVIQLPNYRRLMMATNESWSIPAGMEERRFCVVDVGDDKMQDHQYFGAIEKQMTEEGGREALLHFLLDRDISGVDLRTVPKTEALLSQKLMSMSSMDNWWLDILASGEIFPQSSDVPAFLLAAEDEPWPEWCPTDRLYNLYQNFVKGEKYSAGRQDSKVGFARELRQIAPVKRVRKEVLRDCYSHVTQPEGKNDEIHDAVSQKLKERKWGYSIPSLEECRAHFETRLQQKVDWDAQ